MTKLRISPDLSLPLDWMTLATVVYGARGSGKTTLGSVIAEEVTKAHQRFCAVDLKGDWYGLKSTADGKGEGIPVIVFGGDHADVPLEPDAGAFVGETVAALGQSCILDFEYFSKGKQVRFLSQFFETLYDRNRDPLLLLLDEAQRYAPQKPIDPDAAKCLGAVEDLVKLGRKHGIGPVLFTQRGSGLNKEVSELCDMMVAFRTPGPLDQDRVKGWLEANTTKARMQDVMGTLSGLATGTAVFASGHPDLKVFGTYSVRRRETFDSSATPKVGQRKVEPKKLAQPDLEQLRTKMAAAIERQRADDPKALRAEIASLKRTNAAYAQQIAQPQVETKTERVEVAVLKNGAMKHLDALVTKLVRVTDNLDEVAERMTTSAREIGAGLQPVVNELRRITSAPSALSSTASDSGLSSLHDRRPVSDGSAVRAGPHAVAGRDVSRPRGDGRDVPSRDDRGASHFGVTSPPRNGEPARTTDLSKPDRAILQVLSQYPEGRDAGQITLLTGYTYSGTFQNALSRLRTAGLIEGANTETMRITEEGLARGPFDPLPSGRELIDYWLNHRAFGPPDKAVLRALVEAYPKGMTAEELCAATGYSYSGTFQNALSRLRTAGVLTGKNTGEMKLSETLAGELV